MASRWYGANTLPRAEQTDWVTLPSLSWSESVLPWPTNSTAECSGSLPYCSNSLPIQYWYIRILLTAPKDSWKSHLFLSFKNTSFIKSLHMKLFGDITFSLKCGLKLWNPFVVLRKSSGRTVLCIYSFRQLGISLLLPWPSVLRCVSHLFPFLNRCRIFTAVFRWPKTLSLQNTLYSRFT